MGVGKNERIYTIPEATERVPLSISWWRQQIFRGTIRHLKIGSRVFIPESTIDELLSKSVVEPRNKGKK